MDATRRRMRLGKISPVGELTEDGSAATVMVREGWMKGTQPLSSEHGEERPAAASGIGGSPELFTTKSSIASKPAKGARPDPETLQILASADLSASIRWFNTREKARLACRHPGWLGGGKDQNAANFRLLRSAARVVSVWCRFSGPPQRRRGKA